MDKTGMDADRMFGHVGDDYKSRLPEGRMTLEEFYKSKKYVIVTAISTHRMRYAIPVDELQKLNTDVPIEGHECEWAEDCVTCEEVKEFSQEHIGEQIVDSVIMSEPKMLEQFDKDNEYLSSWTEEQKIKFVRNWRETYGEK